MRTRNFVLPAHFASFLVNGNSTSLELEEVSDMVAFTEKHNLLNCIDCSEQYFSWRNDLNDLGGDVMEFTFEVGE
jgi:hypothetical protein